MHPFLILPVRVVLPKRGGVNIRVIPREPYKVGDVYSVENGIGYSGYCVLDSHFVL